MGEHYLGFDKAGKIVNCYLQSHSKEEINANSRKTITLLDLAGHERYLKTTILGLTRFLPDYAMCVIFSNKRVQRMTKEHLTLCLALNIPFFIVITRIDVTPSHVRQETMQHVLKTLKHHSVQK